MGALPPMEGGGGAGVECLQVRTFDMSGSSPLEREHAGKAFTDWWWGWWWGRRCPTPRGGRRGQRVGLWGEWGRGRPPAVTRGRCRWPRGSPPVGGRRRRRCLGLSGLIKLPVGLLDTSVFLYKVVDEFGRVLILELFVGDPNSV